MYQYGLPLTLTNRRLDIQWKKTNNLTQRTYPHTQEMNHHRSMQLRR